MAREPWIEVLEAMYENANTGHMEYKTDLLDFPADERHPLVRKTGLSETDVGTGKETLEKLGWIEVNRNRGLFNISSEGIEFMYDKKRNDRQRFTNRMLVAVTALLVLGEILPILI